jgi:uncharacterized protein YgbK (DUF1537 family)
VRIVVVADDLTSAADGAAPFRAAGLPARIALGGLDDLDANLPGGARLPLGVTAVDLDTRGGPAALAGARTARAVARLAEADVLVKTMDSTVRGHLAVEIEFAMAAGGRSTAVIAPAFPAEGRYTVGGVQLLNGVPVHDTAFADDPGHPVRTADLTALVPGAVVAGRGPGLAALLGRARYVVADASSDSDLDRIVGAVPDPGEVLWVGSPGLAEALARRLAPGGSLVRHGRPAGQGLGGRVLVVVGSLHPASWAQVTRLEAPDTAALVPVELLPVARQGPVGRQAPVASDEPYGVVVARVERQLAERGVAVLHGPRQRSAGAVPAALADVAARLAARRAFDALVLTGGETARAVLRALGARTIRLTGQPQPGIPLGCLDRPWPLPVALKAGGFGDRDALARLVDQLTSCPAAREPGTDPCAH